MPSGRSAQPYRATSRSAGGRLRGAVEIDGEIPADSTIRPTVDQNVCGTTVALRTIEHNGKRLAGVVVWIEGIREGKPLPLLRRYEVANDDCLLVPRTLATAVGGTVNVHNTDALEHRTRIVRRATGDTLAVVVQHFQGEVVPLDKILDQPGQLELTCDRHPWTHGWIAVFDHPYFDLSSKDGSFAMDSIPPGRYRVVAWHERFGTTADSVTIAEGKEATITITMRAEHP